MTACERVYLEKLMLLNRGNVSRAAIDAGLDRRGLQRLIRRHGMDLGMYRGLRG